MAKISPEDTRMIIHIEYVCGRIHDFGDDLYESLMDGDHIETKEKAQSLIKELADLIQSLSEDI
jgi:hypothetical protein